VRAVPVLAGVLAGLNRLPVGERGIRVGPDRLYAASVDRCVAALCWKLGWLEGPERALLERETGPGMVTVDVGANIGLHTLVLARRVGPAGRVHALEPAADNFRLLARAVTEAGLGQVRLHRAAAADRAGQVSLGLSATNRGDHRVVAAPSGRRVEPVPAVVLDELLAGEPRVDLVKIDVQGAEARVLQGLARTLRRPELRLLCELCPALLAEAGANAEAFFAPLRAAGLLPHRLGRGGVPEPIDEEAAWTAAEAAGYVNLFFSRRAAAPPSLPRRPPPAAPPVR
jgi:FkbM family methyltransferase